MQRQLIADILEDLIPLDPEDKVTNLCANNSLALRQILKAGLDPAVLFDVEIPDWRENKEVDGYASNTLLIEYKKLYIFGDQSPVKPKRKKEILHQILESIDPKDARLLVKVIQKDLSSYGLTPEIVNKAFPGLINNPTGKK